MNVANLLYSCQSLNITTECIQERSLRNIMNVANPLHNTQIIKLTTESLLERNLTNEMKVAYHSINLQVFIFTTESTQEINLTNVGLWQSFTQSSTFQVHQRTHTGKQPCKCSDYVKCISLPSNLQYLLRIETRDNLINVKNVQNP